MTIRTIKTLKIDVDHVSGFTRGQLFHVVYTIYNSIDCISGVIIG